MPNFLAIQSAKERRPKLALPEITVRGFGSVASATLKMGGLTILVGKNNTGKSYVATLLWAMRSLQSLVGRGAAGEAMVAPAWFADEMKRVELQGEGFVELDAERTMEALNSYFKKNKNSFARRIMTFQGASIDSINIELSGKIFLHHNKKIPKGFAEIERIADELSSWYISWKEKLPKRLTMQSAGVTTGSNKADLLFSIAVDAMVRQNLSTIFGSAAYIPAARTGLMLTLGYVASSLIGNLSLNDQSEGGRFSLPTIRFLQMLSNNHRRSTGIGSEIADFLEKSVLHGKIIRESEGKVSYRYKPDQCEHELPMHTVSSMVSELSPILSALRQGSLRDGLVLEEPEAHLHLSAQRYMARAVARLVNKGVPVVITTHSDTFLQQINLLIRLKNHPNRHELMEKYGYLEDDLIDLSDTEAYEFISGSDGTNVQRAEKSENGFVINSLNAALIDIAEEALEIR